MRFSFYSTLAISALLASSMVTAFEQPEDDYELAQLGPMTATRQNRFSQTRNNVNRPAMRTNSQAQKTTALRAPTMSQAAARAGAKARARSAS